MVEKRADGTLVADFQRVPIEMQAELRQNILDAVSLYPDSIQVKIINDTEMRTLSSDEPPFEKGDGGDFIAV
jgi:hypothetical protein